MKATCWFVTGVGTLVLTGTGLAWAATPTWTGASSVFWANPGNWSTGMAPLASEQPVFSDGGANAVAGVTTNTLDGTYVQTGLLYSNRTGLYHTTVLNGYTLLVDGTLGVVRDASADPANNRVRVTVNGSAPGSTLQVGTSTTRRNIELARTPSMYRQVESSLTVSGGNFVGWLQDVRVGNQTSIDHNSVSTSSLLDLSGTAVTTDGLANQFRLAGELLIGVHDGTSGTVKLPTAVTGLVVGGNLQAGIDNAGKIDTTGVLNLSGATSVLNTLSVAGNLWLDNGQIGYDAGGGNYRLPNGVALAIGASGNKKDLRVGYSTGGSNYASRLVMGTGGSISCYLGNVWVGKYNGPHGVVLAGTVDMRGNTLANLTMDSLEVGTFGASVDANGKDPRNAGALYLPSGTAAAGTVKIGDYKSSAGPTGSDYATGTLDMSGTHLDVTASVAIGAWGQVNAHIGSTSGGMDIASAVTSNFTIDNQTSPSVHSGQMHVFFDSACADRSTAPFWGLRMAGDQRAAFNAFIAGNTSASKIWYTITASDPAAWTTLGVYYDTAGNFTYLGLPIPEPGVAGLLGGALLSLAGRRRRT